MKRKGEKTNIIKRFGKRFYKFYFLKPPKNANADELAERLINLKNVEEVYLTDGDYGFVVKTRFSEGMEPNDALDYITKRIGNDFGEVTSYCRYRK